MFYVVWELKGQKKLFVMSKNLLGQGNRKQITFLGLMLLVANFAKKTIQKSWIMTETLANGYSYESTQQELSNEYQNDRVSKVFAFVWFEKKVASALEELLGHFW